MPTIEVSDEQLRYLLCSALEGGSNYWYMHTRSEFPAGVDYVDFEKGGRFGNDEWSWPYLIPFTDGCALIMTTEKAGDEAEFNADGSLKEYRLDRAALTKGIDIMAQKYPRHFANVMTENGDAETGDVYLQCCLFGEIVYG